MVASDPGAAAILPSAEETTTGRVWHRRSMTPANTAKRNLELECIALSLMTSPLRNQAWTLHLFEVASGRVPETALAMHVFFQGFRIGPEWPLRTRIERWTDAMAEWVEQVPVSHREKTTWYPEVIDRGNRNYG